MKEQDKITAAEIKEGMSPAPWDYPTIEKEVNDYNEKWEWFLLANASGSFDKKENAIAAFAAVNNTYGKGYDPEQMHMVIISLEWALNLLEKNGFGNVEDLPYSLAQLSLKKSRI